MVWQWSTVIAVGAGGAVLIGCVNASLVSQFSFSFSLFWKTADVVWNIVSKVCYTQNCQTTKSVLSPQLSLEDVSI